MRKNILTIIIMAIVLINTALTGVLIFAIVPTANRTNKLITKVASIVDLELEDAKDEAKEIAVADIVTYELPDKLTIPLKSVDGTSHYAVFSLSYYMNSKSEDYTALAEKIADYDNRIAEIAQDAFSKYTIEEIGDSEIKEKLKQQVRTDIQDLFDSDFVINVSFGNILTQ